MKDEQPLLEISKEFGIIINEKDPFLGKQILAEKINELINNDFQNDVYD